MVPLALRRDRALRQSLEGARQRVDLLGARLQALDPQRVLARGYAWLGDELGRPLVSVAQMHPGQRAVARLADGEATVEVREIIRKPPQV